MKKLKIQRDLVWKYEGNKIQYMFNAELDDIVKQNRWDLDKRKFEHAQECISEVTDKLKNRNKLIRIADSSDHKQEHDTLLTLS